MKKNIFSCVLIILAVLGGLILLPGCEVTEAGEGTLRLINNSTNVIIVYWSAEQHGDTVEESHTRINPGTSAAISLRSGIFYTIYLEDNYGDGWETRTSVFVSRDKTVEVRFPGDFRVSN